MATIGNEVRLLPLCLFSTHRIGLHRRALDVYSRSSRSTYCFTCSREIERIEKVYFLFRFLASI